MSFIRNTFSKNSYYLIPLLFTIIISSTLFLYEKGTVCLSVNQSCNDFADVFFKNFTHLGDGLVFAVIAIVFLFVSYHYFLMTVVTSLTCMLVAQAMKRLIFTTSLRPTHFFKDLHLVDGVNIHIYNSFPSGHTMAIFSYTLLLALYFSNKKVGLLLFIIAFLGGFSRIYLSQHFFMDVYFGMIIGSFISLCIYYLMEHKGVLRFEALKKNNLIMSIQSIAKKIKN